MQIKKTLQLVVLLLFVSIVQSARAAALTLPQHTTNVPVLETAGPWQAHNYDLVYTVAFSTPEQPDGPLVVYRAPAADLRTTIPVIALARDPLLVTPLFFPSPDGQYLALSTPLSTGFGSSLDGASLSILPTDGSQGSLLLSHGVAIGDQVIWSTSSQALFYHTGQQQQVFLSRQSELKGHALPIKAARRQGMVGVTMADEIHRIGLDDRDTTLLRWTQANSSLRLVGVDRSGALILTLARPHLPIELVRLQMNGVMQLVITLPPDILPGNVLRVGSDGISVECERVLNWNPLRYTIVRIPFGNGTLSPVAPLFTTNRFGPNVNALGLSGDGQVQVMSQVISRRTDLAAQGIVDVPAQEALLLTDRQTGAIQRLELPPGGQIVQVFWTAHKPLAQLHSVPQTVLAGLLAFHKRPGGSQKQNASVFQQDEWMLEGHAGRLRDAPVLPQMCYNFCPQGFTGPPHVSAAILHGIAYTESDWHQFNTHDFQVNGEKPGTPVESFDGGWGEFQQTSGMPPQCKKAGNCRSDASKIEHDQSYNIGTGVQSLIYAWNATAGVVSNNDPNDPYKANHWFFAVWAYNGSYGNNPNDVPSSHYRHWYPGAPFRSIYEEYVWYFAAHPQYLSKGWTDNYLPGLGTRLLPPQSDFTRTSDSFVYCVLCTVPDWTDGSYDRDWVGTGAPDNIASNFAQTFAELGGENVLGLPRDTGSGAAAHRWESGWAQDFGGGSDLPGALMQADGTTSTFWVHGAVWTQYTADHGATGCHGYPTSNLTASSGPGTDSYQRQNFQAGYIVLDVTTGSIALDTCT